MAMDVIQRIMELDGEELENYVIDRVSELEATVDDSFHKLPSSVEGFISKNTEIRVSESSFFGYSMKGVDYLAFAKYLKNSLSDTSIVSLISSTGSYVGNYFGYNPYEPKKKDLRDEIISKEVEKMTGMNDIFDIFEIMEPTYLPSINIFKDNGQAVCLEHSTLMQNLLSFLGIKTNCLSMIALKNKVLSGHAANIIIVLVGDQTRHIYFDLVSMEVFEKEGRLSTFPTMKLISDEEYKEFVQGEKPLVIVRRDAREECGETTTLYLPNSIKNTAKLYKMK